MLEKNIVGLLRKCWVSSSENKKMLNTKGSW